MDRQLSRRRTFEAALPAGRHAAGIRAADAAAGPATPAAAAQRAAITAAVLFARSS
jgi:hypothetical protein